MTGTETQQADCTGYTPIADYALIGNCRSAALISRDGSIDWYCPDRFDAPAVFCRLLDAHRGGYLSVSPDGTFESSRRYLGDTNILETSHRDRDATIVVSDFMAMEMDAAGADTPPTSGQGEMIIRRVHVVEGQAGIRVRFKPTFNYGGEAPVLDEVEGLGLLAQWNGSYVALACDAGALRRTPDGVGEALLHLAQGEKAFIYLVGGRDRDSVLRGLRQRTGQQQLERTQAFWEDWASRCTYRGPYRAAVIRSALVLKLLTFEPSGGVVAAPTTSLPEEIGGVRNWDYRFTWLRDSSLILYALLTVGYHGEARGFLRWLVDVVGRHVRQNPQIMYAIDGERDLPERSLDYLEGYCASRPVRIGNGAAEQHQLDIYGEVLSSAYIHYHRPEGAEDGQSASSGLDGSIDEGTWRVLRALVEDAVRVWKQPDNGIWEVRGGPQDFLYSKLLCWTAVDRGIRLAQEHDLEADVSRWESVRDEMRTAIEQRGYNRELGAFVQAFGSDTLDAAALAVPRVGFLPATHPWVLSTIDRIQRDLTRNGLVYRYRAEDGLPGGEGAFLLCTFWLVDDLALAGRIDQAREVFEHVLGMSNDLGLFSEELDPSTGTFLGNFPQGFTHLALIRAAVDLAKVDKHGAEERPETEGERMHRARRATAQGHG